MTNKTEQIDINKLVYCIDESTYSQHLSKHKSYIVAEIGNNSKIDKIRVNGDMNKLVWIPETCFSVNKQPSIISINIDDTIENINRDSIEVTIVFEDGKKSWLRVLTPEYLEKDLLRTNKFYYDQNALFLKTVSKHLIEEAIIELDKANELIQIIIPYQNEN